MKVILRDSKLPNMDHIPNSCEFDDRTRQEIPSYDPDYAQGGALTLDDAIDGALTFVF